MMGRASPEGMPERARALPVDYTTLASFLSALAYPVRLQILDALRFPHRLGELKLSPLRTQGGNPERTAARETIRAHIDKLVETDLVRSEQVEEDGRLVARYAVNPQKLYALTEELRRLSTMYAGRGGTSDATGTLAARAQGVPARGPRLVLVHGVYEGKAFPMTPKSAADHRWVIGRKRGLPVSLDYDPYVSVENAAVVLQDDAYHVEDIRGSKNGTSVNWELLPPGGTRPVRSGDIIGVGRSLLCFVRD